MDLNLKNGNLLLWKNYSVYPIKQKNLVILSTRSGRIYDLFFPLDVPAHDIAIQIDTIKDNIPAISLLNR